MDGPSEQPVTGALSQSRQQTQPYQQNPLLQQIIEETEAKVTDELKDEFLSVMVAGGQLMWSKELLAERQEFDKSLKQSGDVPTVVAHSVLKILSVIQNESGREQPIEAVGLAAPIFMAHTLQYVESRHKMPVNEQVIGETAQLISANLLKMYGVTEEHMKELIRQRAEEQAGQQPPVEESDEDLPSRQTSEDEEES